MKNFLIPEGCCIDLSHTQAAVDLIFELGNLLESGEFTGKKVRVDLGSAHLNEAQILSVKTLIESVDSEISVVYTNSTQTQMAALHAGLLVSDEETEIACYKEQQVIEEEPEEIDPLEEIKPITIDPPKSLNFETRYIKQTLRSGQTVSFDGNVVIIGDCHPGSEVNASGDITVWGVLGGIAHAGIRGDENARIRALKINAIQLRIAGYFARRPDQVELDKMEKTNTFVPEEAKISDGDIIIYTLNSN